MSVDSRTRQQPTQPPAPRSRSGFNPLTLAIAAASSVAAAVIVSKVWAGGTLWATAMTPVVVAMVKEALERPAQKIDVGVSRLSTVRQAEPDALVVEEFEPGHEAEPSDVTVYGARGHKWKLALITGLLAAVVAIAALTLPELVAGRSIISSGKKTTLFQGRRHRSNTTTTTQSTQTQTVTQTTQTQTVTQTVPSATQTTPTVTQTTPGATQTTPPATTTAPSGGATTPTTPSP